MLRLIEKAAERVLPATLHRLGLKAAHRLRHRWRRLTKPHLSGVSVILRDGEGRVLLVKHSYGPDYWSLPGGGLDGGENAETAARREMREELGVELAALQSLGTLEEELSGTRHTAHLFTARPEGAIAPDGREVAEARFFAPDALPENIGRIARGRLQRKR